MQDPSTCFGRDGLYAETISSGPAWHFPRLMGEYGRDAAIFTLEDVVRKMTSQPARRLELNIIGLAEPGFHADLVSFDPAKVEGPATFDRPPQDPVGIRDVLLFGRFAVRDGQPTGVRVGRTLRAHRTNLDRRPTALDTKTKE